MKSVFDNKLTSLYKNCGNLPLFLSAGKIRQQPPGIFIDTAEGRARKQYFRRTLTKETVTLQRKPQKNHESFRKNGDFPVAERHLRLISKQSTTNFFFLLHFC